MDRLGTPWAFAFGNHDRSHGASVTAMEELMRKSATCVYCHGDEGVAGDGNYCVRLFDGEKLCRGCCICWIRMRISCWTEKAITRILNIRRSNGTGAPGTGFERSSERPPRCFSFIYRCMNIWMSGKKSAASVKKRNSYLKRVRAAPSLLFFIYRCMNIWMSGKKSAFGEKNEAVCYSYLNSGLFCALQEDVSAKGVFVGHDHTNDYIGELYGVRLAYGRGTGFGGGGRGGYGKDGFYTAAL